MILSVEKTSKLLLVISRGFRNLSWFTKVYTCVILWTWCSNHYSKTNSVLHSQKKFRCSSIQEFWGAVFILKNFILGFLWKRGMVYNLQSQFSNHLRCQYTDMPMQFSKMFWHPYFSEWSTISSNPAALVIHKQPFFHTAICFNC